MLVLVLMLCALAARAHGDCDACVAGRCHSRRPIVSGFPVTDQLAIDRTNNALYLQFTNYINTAIFLDDLEIRLVNMMTTTGMAVNQETQLLYMGTREVDDTVYTYSLVNNTTHSYNVEDYGAKPMLMFYGANDLFFIDSKYSSVMKYDMIGKNVWHKKYLNNYSISDFVIGEGQKIFFVTDDNVYLYHNKASLDGIESPKLIINKKDVLSVDKYDTVYFADATEKVIYKRDKTTQKLEVYASYKSGSIEDFVFDKNNRIVFRDGNSVAQWVPTSTDRICSVGHNGNDIQRELTNQDQ